MKVWNNGFNIIAYLIAMIILFPAADAYICVFMGCMLSQQLETMG